MKIKRLEIFGFKAFKDAFVLNFNGDLVGIIGPNGCGKSNVIDALRWVLGESQARQLRGSIQEDLIFNGSESSKSMGMAEVSITFEISPGWVPAIGDESDSEEHSFLRSLGAVEGLSEKDLNAEAVTQDFVREGFFQLPDIFNSSEIQITRRLYRSGESECYINKVSCRLKDIVDLCRAIGIGSRGLHIVQQGSIGEIITKKPIERRELIEEAAGIAGFRARLEVAQGQLLRTQENISRIKDIHDEVSKQLRTLKRQAARAKARAEQKEHLRITELKLYALRVRLLVEQRLASRERIHQLEGECNSLRALIEEAKEVYETTLATESKLDKKIMALRSERKILRQELEKLKEEENQLKIELARSEARLKSIESSSLQNIDRERALDEEMARCTATIEILEARALDIERKKIEAEGDLLCSQNQNNSPDSVNLTATAAKHTDEIKTLTERLECVEESASGSPVDEVLSLSILLDKCRKTLKIARDKLSDDRADFAALQASISSLQSQLDSFTNIAVNAIVDESIFGVTKDKIGKALLAGIYISQSSQMAFFAILGEKFQFLVTENAWELLAAYAEKMNKSKSKVRSAKFGVVHVAPSMSYAPEISSEEHAIAATVRYLVDEVSISPDYIEYGAVVKSLLAGVLLVDTLVEANSLAQLFAQVGWNGRVVVTVSGEVVCQWGWYSTAGDGASLSLAMKLKEQQSKVTLAKEAFEESSLKVKELESELANLESCHKSKEEERRLVAQDQKRLSQLLQVVRESERKERQESINKERVIQKRVNDLSVELSFLRAKVEGEKRRVDGIFAEKDELLRKREKLSASQIQFKIEYNELHNKLLALRNNLQVDRNSAWLHIQQEMSAKDRQIINLENLKKDSRQILISKTKEIDLLHSKLDGLSEEVGQLRVKVEKAEVEIQMLTEEFRRYYGEDANIPTEIDLSSEETKDLLSAIRALQGTALKIRHSLDKEGEVDPEVVLRCDQEQERYDNLSTQLKDLSSSLEVLERTTKYLTNISRIRFMKTFTFISEKFSELIPRLFGGGAGQMELVDPNDPLESGIELKLRPPGKSLKNLELLSGGEKALAAIAILVALFLRRPGPICVMDEVDAPLDDANLGKFMGLIREISSQTQFLIITHNKQTMVNVDRLVGITMQERGVSIAVEVSLNQAMKDVDAYSQRKVVGL